MEQTPTDETEAKETGPAEDLPPLEADRPATDPVRSGDALFWRALAVAVLFHAAMFIQLGSSSSQRRMGEPEGDPNTIAVDVMDESGLPALAAPPVPPPSPPPIPPSPPEPEQAAAPPSRQAEAKPIEPPFKEPPVREPPVSEPPRPEPPRQEPPPEQRPAEHAPAPEQKDVPVKQARVEPDIRGATDPYVTPSQEPPSQPPPTPLPPAPQLPSKQAATQPRPPERPTPQKSAEAVAMERELMEMFAPDPRRNQQQPRPKANPTDPSQPAEPSPLDQPVQFQPNSSSVARPVDISRTGENNEFGRNVIRALRETMPRPVARARVTIKFYLSESGEVADIRLVQGSGYPLMDQFVLVAASNSKFPLPPPGSKTVDRIFLVTYIYD